MSELSKQQVESKNRLGKKLLGFFLMLIFICTYSVRNDGFERSLIQPMSLILNSATEYGDVVRCDEVEVSTSTGNMSNRSSRGVTYAPVAISQSGIEAKGSYIFGLNSPDWCRSLLGKKVKIRTQKKYVEKSRISSFSQLWYPIYQGFLALIWLCFAPRSKNVTRASLFINGVLFPALFFSGYSFLY